MKRVLDLYRDILSSADVILISGDITDTGHADEWKMFFDLIPKDWLPKMVLVPGNHDLNITTANPREAFQSAGYENVPRQLRMARFLMAMDFIDSGRTRILVDDCLVGLRGFLNQKISDLHP